MNITYIFFCFSLSLFFYFFIGFSGELCNYEYNECDSNPCLNDGQCTDHIGGFSCKCTRGYTGKRCHIKVSSIFFYLSCAVVVVRVVLVSYCCRIVAIFLLIRSLIVRRIHRSDISMFQYVCAWMFLFLWSLYLFSVVCCLETMFSFPFYYFPLFGFCSQTINFERISGGIKCKIDAIMLQFKTSKRKKKKALSTAVYNVHGAANAARTVK